MAVLAGAVVAPSSAQVNVEVRTIDREELTGELVQFSLQEGLILRPDSLAEPVSIAAVDLVRVAPVKPVADLPRGPVCLLLDTGDRLYGQLSGSGPEKFVMDTILGTHVAVPFERVQQLTTPLADRPRWFSLIARAGSSQNTEDLALLSNGDVIGGLLAHVDPESIILERSGAERRVDLAVTVALLLANEVRSSPHGLRARIRFVDGSTLDVSEVHWTPAGLDLSCFDGTFQGLAHERVRDLEIRGARWNWLGQDVALAAWEHTPQMSLIWPARQDRNAVGGRLRLRGRDYERGFGVHSRSVLSFDLNGRYSIFSATCGLDDAAGDYANVVAAVLVDERVVWENPSISRGDPPQALHLDIAGARTLQLRVDFGANGDIQDYFDWADAALIQ